MEYQRKVVSAELIMGPLLDLLDEVEAVPLVITGGSMTPFLVHGRDTVYLSKVKRPLRRGDMVLFHRDNGSYVLHRIFRVEEKTHVYTMIGDAQTVLEHGIRQDQIKAVVTAVNRKDKLLKRNNFWWFFFEKIWIRMVPMRPAVRKLYTAFFKKF